jgi:arginyl-tRNA synthetase
MEDNKNNEQYLDSEQHLDNDQLDNVIGGAWFGGQRAHAESMISIFQKNARFSGRKGNNQALADQLEAINQLNAKIKGF